MKSCASLLLTTFIVSRSVLADTAYHCTSSTQLFSGHRSCHHSSNSTEVLTSTLNPSKGIVVDTNEHDPRPYFPWTHKPLCYVSTTDAIPKLCVYTNASFSAGRGISIFTTPSLAREFSQLPAFTNPSVLSKANGNHEPPTYVKSLRGRGKGMLAERDLKRGELITAYTPLLLVYREETLSSKEREFFLRTGVEQLNAKSRLMYEGLARIYRDERVKTQDVLKANVFGMEVGGMEHLAVWPEPARCNHACGPNAQYRIDPNTLVHSVHAARDIAEDEEITLTYINPFNPHDERQKQLSSAFAFKCKCDRCRHPSRSNQAIQEIQSLEKKLGDWTPSKDGKLATVEDAEMLISLYKQEGLDGFLDVPYGHATLMYNAAGDEAGAKKYARLARDAVGLKEGTGQGDWKFWRRMEVGPRQHWSWGKRKD